MGAIGEFAQTEKQTEIMGLVISAVDAGAYITLNDLRDKLSYKPSKQAVLCSINFLIGHGFLVTTLHGNRSMEIKPTALAYATFRPRRTVPRTPEHGSEAL